MAKITPETTLNLIMIYLTIIKNKGVASDEVHLTVSLHEVVSQ